LSANEISLIGIFGLIRLRLNPLRSGSLGALAMVQVKAQAAPHP